ncbi:hypothetical protein AVEN_11665-1 [Araneus ventricosus]|uniref:Uncharacterized protein n=1 Tax=Araneus ventricosus TaxID=182803 RepID=A0A4Y2M7P9_ARAVE|nr:hypothetical protein AVEN_11665-1 [Araneus ventricosus]
MTQRTPLLDPTGKRDSAYLYGRCLFPIFEVSRKCELWPNCKVSASWPEGSRFEIRFHSISAVYCGLLYVKLEVGGQTSSRLCGAGIWRRGTSSGVVLVI